MSFLRGEQDIDTSVRKAISPEESAPKRKHVRACVVYTWDHRNGKQFWHAVRMLPIQNDPVMTFKGLIVTHKVLQEGHRTVLREAQHHVEWIRSLAASASGGGYRQLIDEYVRLMLHKLEFHRLHADFNGTFEYEEYVSLRNVDDPNEGYESVTDLMHLQDSIFDFQRLVFASLGAAARRSSSTGATECRASSLTAMVTESYGIYRFVTSMLRALHQQSDPEVLAPLLQRYEGQHRRLRMFYADCRGIKYLVSIISIPELPRDPPDLLESNERAPSLPKRPRELAPMSTGATTATTATEPDPQPIVPEATGNWWQGQQFVPESTLSSELAQQQALEEQHILMLQQREQELALERQRQEQLALQAQQQFEAEQAALLAQQQQQQLDFQRQQQQMQYQDQAVAMQQEMQLLRNQQQEAQSMLQQYDQRVQSLEADLSQMASLTQQQIDAKTEQLDSVQEQVDTWKSKYESLAKLYSQLRHEHLELMSKFRKVQTKAASAHEAVEKREKAERDLKAKNLELADLIRERDRARYELDKSRGRHGDEVERLERSISLLNDRVAENDRSRASDISSLSSSHARQIQLLEAQLAEKAGSSDVVKSKDEEIAILNQQIEQMGSMMNDLSIDAGSQPRGLASILDAVLSAAYETVQQGITSFDSPVEPGNQNTNPVFVLSVNDNVMTSTDAFADAFTDYIAEGATGDPVRIITGATTLSASVKDLLFNVKGVTALATQNQDTDVMTEAVREAATSVCTFFSSLQSEILETLTDIEDKIELVVTNHVEVAKFLQDLAIALEALLPKTGILGSGSLNDQVDGAMGGLESAVASAEQRMAQLRSNAAQYALFDRDVNEAILGAASALTAAIGVLIHRSIDCQREVVANGRHGQSPENYYKKNHRWTEGLISAARTVGSSTNVLIDIADGTLTGKRTPEELIVGSREVASSIAQLVSASRVKTGHQSKTQGELESASTNVTAATKQLVQRVEEIMAKGRPDVKKIDYSKLSPMEFKSTSMEQQVEVLKLEQDLMAARNRLFEIRKLEYVLHEQE